MKLSDIQNMASKVMDQVNDAAANLGEKAGIAGLKDKGGNAAASLKEKAADLLDKGGDALHNLADKLS